MKLTESFTASDGLVAINEVPLRVAKMLSDPLNFEDLKNLRAQNQKFWCYPPI